MTNSYTCPYCGATNRHRVSSAGTVKRCEDCGQKYRLNDILEEVVDKRRPEPEPESSGCGGCMLWALLAPTTVLLSLCCMGLVLAPFTPKKDKEDKQQPVEVKQKEKKK